MVYWLCMKVVIVGGGFGGLKAAIELAKLGGFEITLVSDREYLLHHGLLYSTAAGRDPKESAVPVKEIIAPYPAITFYRDRISEIDTDNQTVYGQKSSYSYDELVLSPGLSEYFYGTNGAKQHSYTMGSLEGVKAFSAAVHDGMINDGGLVCAIIGGGATGVELTGALAEYADRVAKAHSLARPSLKMVVFEKGSRLVPTLSNTASTKLNKRLNRQGVEMRLGQTVGQVSKRYIVSAGQRTDIDMAVWTCGGQISQLFLKHPEVFSVSKRGRVLVNQYLSAYPNIYVIGDSADGPFNGLASSAIKHARFIAQHLKRQDKGLPPRTFRAGRPPLVSVPTSRFWAYSERYGVYASGFLGAMIRRLSELNSYTHFLDIEKSYKLWRRQRNSQQSCRLCRRNMKMS